MSSFLHSLDAEAREELLRVARPVSFVPGATLVRHGETARGAYVVREGTVEAAVTMPGGDTVTVARLGPGDIFGEMALIELGSCTATIRATSPVDGWFIANEDFRALASQCHAAAIRLQHAVTSILAARIAALNAQLLATPAAEDRPARAVAGGDPLESVPRLRKAPFDADAFLARLPLFQRFCAEEIDEVASRGAWIELPRGHAIFHAGTEARSTFVVARGAVEIVAMDAGRERRIAVLGPGQMVGHMSVLRGSPHSSHGFAREASLMLEIPAKAFVECYFGASRASARVRGAVQWSLLAAMARTNRALTRLISQARLDASHRSEAELEVAYHSQLTTTA